MAKQAKGLKTLIRLSKFEVDEKRRVLTALQNQEEQILHDILQSEVQLRKEQELAASDATGVGFIYGAYHRAWMDQRQMLFNRLATIRQQIEIARDELAEAFRTQKTYEVTQANRERREREEMDRKEQTFLDEVAQTQHRRRENPQD
ncbi:MAG: flagellar FliJ family protein [Magnetospirillum sp.]|nr:flagellar FliJ family protein [Magnetospirillum sp.]